MTSTAKDHDETFTDASITPTSVIIVTLCDPDGDNCDSVLTVRIPKNGSVVVHLHGSNDIENGSFNYLIVNP